MRGTEVAAAASERGAETADAVFETTAASSIRRRLEWNRRQRPMTRMKATARRPTALTTSRSSNVGGIIVVVVLSLAL
jgi:hypothetical protein